MAASETGLAGTRVLVTRPTRQASALARYIQTTGGEAILFPTIEIAGPSDPTALVHALDARPHADFAIFVSPNAVEHGLKYLRQHGSAPSPRFAAVGAATAQALRTAGVGNVLVPTERFDSAALLTLLPANAVRGRIVLLFHGEGGRDEIAATLTARGAQVVHLVCYRRVLPAAPDASVRARLVQGDVDVISVTSVDGLRNLLTLAGEAARARLLATPLIVISDRQAQAARDLGFHAAIHVAARADDIAIVDALLSWRHPRKVL